ncbi:hypothetical protein D3C86_1952260 [compost metagenome]
MAVLHRPGQIREDQLHRSQRGCIGYRIGSGCNQGFDRMGQRIHPGCRCKCGRFVDHQLGIIDRNGGDAVFINHNHLHFAFFICDDVVDSDFGGGAGGCVDRYNRQ